MKIGFEVIQSIHIHGKSVSHEITIKYNGVTIFNRPWSGYPPDVIPLNQFYSILESIHLEVLKWAHKHER